MKYTLEHAKRGTDIHQHLVTLHDLVTSIRAQLVLELGVNTGESTIALLEAVHATGGTLISVDQQDLPQTRPMLERYGLTGKWQFQGRKGGEAIALPTLIAGLLQLAGPSGQSKH